MMDDLDDRVDAERWHQTDPDAWQDARDAMRDEWPAREGDTGLWPAPGFPPHISTDRHGRLWCDVTNGAELIGVASVVALCTGRVRVTFDGGRVRDYYSNDVLEVVE